MWWCSHTATPQAELLNGQKLQGVLTSNEVQEIIARNGWEASFPLFTTINAIVNGRLEPSAVVRYRCVCLCAVSIDGALCNMGHLEHRDTWRDGLAPVDQSSSIIDIDQNGATKLSPVRNV